MLAAQLLTSTLDYQQQSAINPAATIVGGLFGYVLTVIALWPVFTKAGRPGWAALIPIYNTYTLVKIGGYHGALTILFFLPIANIVAGILVGLGVGRAFGKSTVFSIILLWLLSIIGFLIIGYGKAVYRGDGGHTTRRT